VPEQFLRRTHQVESQTFDLMVRVVDECLKVALQMRPAPLQPPLVPVHFRSVAVLGNVADLVPQRLRIAARERFATPAATRGFDGDERLTLIGGNQGPFVLGMSRLAAGFPAGGIFPRGGLGVRMLAAGGRSDELRGVFLVASSSALTAANSASSTAIRFS
jgi:hypothetical protein